MIYGDQYLLIIINNNNINNKSNKHNKISLTAPISSQCRSRRPGLQIVSDKRTKMQSLNLNLDKKEEANSSRLDPF